MLVNNYNSILKRKSSNWQPETITQKNRIEADGGIVIDLPFMNRVIYTLKALGIYGNAKLLTDANFGVKKDITGAVSKLYDISGNNNDAVQATGASQPIWSLVNGKGVITYSGVDDFLQAVWNESLTVFSILDKVNYTLSQSSPGICGFTNSSGIRKDVYINANNTIRIFNNSFWKITSTLTSLNNGLNHNIAGIFDGVDSIAYVDGIKYITSSSNATSPQLASIIRIGAIIANTMQSAYYFNGQINSSTIFNIALIQEQITTLYNLGL